MIIRNRCKETFYKIYAKYKDDMWIHKGPNEDGFYSRILAREVAVTREACDDPDDYDVFAFLHEVGHVLTNKPYQKRCLQEYLASQWALDDNNRLCEGKCRCIITVSRNENVTVL